MTTGRINYAPDYKSEKRKPLNPRVKISPGGRPYVETKDLVDSVLRRIRGTSDPDRETERARLCDAVIGAAIAWNSTNHRDEQACEQRLIELGDAVDALIQFEAREK